MKMRVTAHSATHRIIGDRSPHPYGGKYAGVESYAGNKPTNYGQEYTTLSNLLQQISLFRLVSFGEIHSTPQVLALQLAVEQ
ncbi:MAG: hypothetical protein ACREOZ_00585 [Gloeomargaritales cyanobacterium]